MPYSFFGRARRRTRCEKKSKKLRVVVRFCDYAFRFFLVAVVFFTTFFFSGFCDISWGFACGGTMAEFVESSLEILRIRSGG